MKKRLDAKWSNISQEASNELNADAVHIELQEERAILFQNDNNDTELTSPPDEPIVYKAQKRHYKRDNMLPRLSKSNEAEKIINQPYNEDSILEMRVLEDMLEHHHLRNFLSIDHNDSEKPFVHIRFNFRESSLWRFILKTLVA